MTPLSTLRRIGAPLGSAAATAILFTGALWVQHERSAWPFAPQRDAVALTGSGMLTVATTAPTHDRVAVDVSAATVQELGIRLEEQSYAARSMEADDNWVRLVCIVVGWCAYKVTTATGTALDEAGKRDALEQLEAAAAG